MTTSLKILILAAIMLIGPAYGQAKFLSICENPQSRHRHEMKWLKMFFEVQTCQELAEKISKLHSYNEFFLHFSVSGQRQEHSWLKAFPHFYGIKSTHSVELVPTHKLGPGLNFGTFFKDPEIYSEFKNLKVFDFTNRFEKTPCELLKRLPHIELALVDRQALENLKECQPVSNLPDLVSVGDFLDADSNPKLNKKIIGVEYMVGMSRHMHEYSRLRYLGLSFPFKEEYNYHSLIQNQNITHLSFNSTESLEYAYVLGELPNLSFLSISCITSFKDIYISPGLASDSPEYCRNANLKNVNFLKSLPFLEEIILDFEGLEDVSALKEMPQLKLVTHPLVP